MPCCVLTLPSSNVNGNQPLLPVIGENASYPLSSAFVSFSPLGDQSAHILLHLIFFSAVIYKAVYCITLIPVEHSKGFAVAAAPLTRVEVRKNTHTPILSLHI